MIANPIPLPLGLQRFSIAESKDAGSQKIKFVNPNTDNFDRNIRNAAELLKKHNLKMPRPNQHLGRGAVIVGSGPSLNQEGVLQAIKERVVQQGFVLFATKAAIDWLHENGLTADYGVSMDPGAHIAAPHKIRKVPGVTHIIASSSDPHLFQYLMEENEHGPASAVMIFHSACGLKNTPR